MIRSNRVREALSECAGVPCFAAASSWLRARLSPPHREVLRLTFQHGFSASEVAQILDVPLGTVKSRISYARRALIQEYAHATAHEEETP